MAKLEIELTAEMLKFLDDLVATGRFADREDALQQIFRKHMRIAKAVKVRKKGTPAEDTGGNVVIQDTGGDVVIQLKKLLDL